MADNYATLANGAFFLHSAALSPKSPVNQEEDMKRADTCRVFEVLHLGSVKCTKLIIIDGEQAFSLD